jgi:hypothetical protein
MFGFALAGSAACAVVGEWRAAAGFALGAGLGILGYFWLHETVVAMLGSGSVAKPRGLIAKLVLRYLLMAAVIYFGQRTGWMPVLAIFAGLLVPGAGALAESLVLIREGLRTSPHLH